MLRAPPGDSPGGHALLSAHAGPPRRKSLESLVRKGEIDTVLTVFSHGLSRLMGKRLTARHFLEHALDDGVHACIYLFTVDMEMEPLPGFTLTSWSAATAT